MLDKKRSCDECSFPPFLGTRCAKHYVARKARRRALSTQSWWPKFEQTIVGVIVARHLAIMDGDEWVREFNPEHVFGGLKYKKIADVVAIVKQAEVQSRKQKGACYGGDSRSEKDRG
jgi:hypothetical protein